MPGFVAPDAPVDANSIDILLTWLVNHDRQFLQGDVSKPITDESHLEIEKSTQGNRRTLGGRRQHEAILSLYAGVGCSRLALFRRHRCQAERKRLSRRMAH